MTYVIFPEVNEPLSKIYILSGNDLFFIVIFFLLFSAYRSVVSIMFRDDDFLYTQRSEIHGWADFIANFGGLLGLFLGVSILSIVEIIYFISFRQLNEESINPSISNLSANVSIAQKNFSVSTRSLSKLSQRY